MEKSFARFRSALLAHGKCIQTIMQLTKPLRQHTTNSFQVMQAANVAGFSANAIAVALKEEEPSLFAKIPNFQREKRVVD